MCYYCSIVESGVIVMKLNEYKDKLAKANAELLTLTDGSLTKRGKFYCHMVNRKQVGITKNEKLKQQLCRRKHLLTRKKELSNNIAILERIQGKIQETTDEEIISSFTGAYSEMPRNYFYHPSVEKWLTDPHIESLFRPEDLKYFSNKGTKLRSKSEALIANKLEDYNLFYRYEPKIKLKNGTTIYPDFAIIDLYTGEIILWEHFGALHIEGYEKKMNKKMADYLELGYIPFETIIYTFESDVLNPERLKYLIEKIILGK